MSGPHHHPASHVHLQSGGGSGTHAHSHEFHKYECEKIKEEEQHLGEKLRKAKLDTTIIKIDSAFAPKGKQGQKYLAIGSKMAMRLWENEPVGAQEESIREYETVGYALNGKAELHVEGQMVILNKGDSWVVPAHCRHYYKILESFSAVEATSPPCSVYGRDETKPQGIKHH